MTRPSTQTLRARTLLLGLALLTALLAAVICARAAR